VIFNDCHILCIELPDDGPYVTETCSVWKYIFVVSTVFWLIILYICNTQQDAHCEDIPYSRSYLLVCQPADSLKTIRSDIAVFQFSRYNLFRDPTENTASTRSSLVAWHSYRLDPTEHTVPQLVWLTWYHESHCSGTVCLAPDHLTTPLPAAHLLLHDITAVMEMIFLLNHCLAPAGSLASLFHLSSVMSRCIRKRKLCISV
jgi:hypothetical protein